MIQCILVNLGLKWFVFEITTNALRSIIRRCSGNECPGSLFMDLNELQKLRTRRQRKRRLKSEFALFQSLSQLFLSTYFVKCRRTLMELNCEGPYPSSEREIKFRRCLFTHSIKREIRGKEMYKKE